MPAIPPGLAADRGSFAPVFYQPSVPRRLVRPAVKSSPYFRIEIPRGRLRFNQSRGRCVRYIAVVVPSASELYQQVPVLVVVAHSSNEAAFDGGAFEGIEAQGPRFLTPTSSASAEGANNIKAAKVTVRDLEGTEDSINHSSAAAADATLDRGIRDASKRTRAARQPSRPGWQS